ncbi:FAD-dependent monooxygenase [Microtetraspora sp. NBRC 16547]|uniref:FAD-dependent monooxygenase n=1 Tax=Microtetraspora sp. NBRC 16547 TaxID=3030993 RepID=UPI0024A22920|nr:FAD-dependent monooxygenase [Microtetraspora sp. NBRC 16547]GLW99621.1 FAD-dependent oxidoreductase [Microtetraspora sp. NBRC 16547]
MNANILISGASVAGPALAYWLRHYGFTPTVVERAPALRDGGYAVDFRGDAHFTVLERMGILADVQRAQTHMGALSYVNSAGKKLASMPADLFSGDVEILRGDLARILYEATKEHTEYVFGDSITSISERADGVQVTFERGAPRMFDLVIGADGLHSNVRSLAFGPESSYVKDLGLHFAIFTTDNYLGLDHTGLAYSTPGKLVGLYSARGNAEAKAVFYFGSPSAPYDRHDTEQQKKIVAETFGEAGWEAPRLLRAMGDAPDFYFDSISQVRMDRWSHGRVALIGDAAYSPSPLSGMGSGLAVIGAYVLAGELAAARGDHRIAFARYEDAMRDYVAGCQKQGEGVGKWMVPENRFMAWFLNQNYKLIPYLPWKGLMARSVRKTASAITLKSYASFGLPV